MSHTPRVVSVVHDDDMVRESICMLVRTMGMTALAYASARDFLDDAPGRDSDCLVLDVRMPGISGLELQQRLVEQCRELPIIFVSGHGDIPMAVQAMRHGALDFLQKPFSEQVLLDRINGAVQLSRSRRQRELNRVAVVARHALLTPRERDVMDCILRGGQNKTIAQELAISIRTVEQHRAQVMRKMRVRTVAELSAAAALVASAAAGRFAGAPAGSDARSLPADNP
jgi:FixJ family two-component response regulator